MLVCAILGISYAPSTLSGLSCYLERANRLFEKVVAQDRKRTRDYIEEHPEHKELLERGGLETFGFSLNRFSPGGTWRASFAVGSHCSEHAEGDGETPELAIARAIVATSYSND